jgi:hypothetical protein
MVGTGLIWLRIGTLGGAREHGNEPSGSINSWEVLELLHNWQLLKKGLSNSRQYRPLKITVTDQTSRIRLQQFCSDNCYIKS